MAPNALAPPAPVATIPLVQTAIQNAFQAQNVDVRGLVQDAHGRITGWAIVTSAQPLDGQVENRHTIFGRALRAQLGAGATNVGFLMLLDPAEAAKAGL